MFSGINLFASTECIQYDILLYYLNDKKIHKTNSFKTRDHKHPAIFFTTMNDVCALFSLREKQCAIACKPQRRGKTSRIAVGKPAQNRVLWLVLTFIIEMNECPFNFNKFLELHLQSFSDGVSFFEGQISRELDIDLTVTPQT